MKKMMFAAAAAAMVAGVAYANEPEVVYELEATVSGVCGAYNANPNPLSIDFGDLAAIPAANTVTVGGGSVSYRCNSPAGFTRTISSANGGALHRVGTAGGTNNQISYTFQHGGGSGLGIAATQLTSAINTNFPGNAAFLSGQTGGVTFAVNGVLTVNANANQAPGTTVFAGDYADTVTISVTAL